MKKSPKVPVSVSKLTNTPEMWSGNWIRTLLSLVMGNLFCVGRVMKPSLDIAQMVFVLFVVNNWLLLRLILNTSFTTKRVPLSSMLRAIVSAVLLLFDGYCFSHLSWTHHGCCCAKTTCFLSQVPWWLSQRPCLHERWCLLSSWHLRTSEWLQSAHERRFGSDPGRFWSVEDQTSRPARRISQQFGHHLWPPSWINHTYHWIIY